MEQQIEIWKDIKEFEGYYQVSNLGRVKSLNRYVPNKNNKNGLMLLKSKIKMLAKRYGYYYVNLYKNAKGYSWYVHRIVAQAFIPNPENKPQVNHIDGNKLNNNVNNLEWVTCSENILHAIKTKLIDIDKRDAKKDKAHNKKLTSEQVDFIRKKYVPGLGNLNQAKLGKMFNVEKSTISKIINNINWKED